MTLEELEIVIEAQTREFQQQLNNVSNQVAGMERQVNKSLGNIKNIFGRVGKWIAALGFGKIIKDSIITAMDSIESDSMFDTVFGKLANDVQQWSEELQNSLGLNGYAIRENVATLYNMTKSMGLASKEALTLSKDMTLLAEDMASFYNLNSSEAFNKIRAGLTGETEPLKQLGILVDEATIKQYAYANGIAVAGAELTNTQKVMARYGAIAQQASTASGDLARTLDSPSNQLRILRNNLNLLMIELGRAFMPIVQVVLPILNTFVQALTKVTSVVARFMNALFGTKASSGNGEVASSIQNINSAIGGTSDAYDKAGSSAEKAAKKTKGFLAGFDEINKVKINDDSDSGSSGGGSADDSGIDIPGLDLTEQEGMLNEMLSEVEKFAQKVRSVLIELFRPIKESFEKYFPQIEAALEGIKHSTGRIFNSIGKFLRSLWDAGLGDIVGHITGILINIGIIAARIYSEIIAPVISAVIDFLNPENNPVTRFLIETIANIFGELEKLFAWLGGDGFAVIETIIVLLSSFAISWGLVTLAIKAYSAIATIGTAITTAWSVVVTAFNTVVGFCTSTVGLWVIGIAAVIAIGYLLWKNWNEISIYLKQLWEALKEWGINTWNSLKENLVEIWTIIKDKTIEMWNSIKQFFIDTWNSLKNKATEIWNSIKDFLSNTWNGIKSTSSSIWNEIKDVCVNVFNNIKGFITNIMDSIKQVFNGIVNFVVGVFTGNWRRAWQGVQDIFSGIFNGLVSLAKAPINLIINAVNTMIRGLNKIKLPDWIPGIGGVGINIPEIPMLAKGGIINSPTLAMVGEAGKEAVMPLENNTGWITDLASKVADRMPQGSNSATSDVPIEITLQIGSTKLGKVVIDSINKVQRQAGKPLIVM